MFRYNTLQDQRLINFQNPLNWSNWYSVHLSLFASVPEADLADWTRQQLKTSARNVLVQGRETSISVGYVTCRLLRRKSYLTRQPAIQAKSSPNTTQRKSLTEYTHSSKIVIVPFFFGVRDIAPRWLLTANQCQHLLTTASRMCQKSGKAITRERGSLGRAIGAKSATSLTLQGLCIDVLMSGFYTRRKIKCDGAQPCEVCNRAKATCTFNSSYARGRPPVIRPTRTVEAGSNSILVTQPASNTETDDGSIPVEPVLVQPTQHIAGLQSQNISSSYLDPESSNESSPEPSQTDLQGHYIGPASGVSFLLRVQKRLHQAISFSDASTIFTFGDAPLQVPDFDPSFCMMLPRDDAQRLVDRYFDFAMPTYRFLHRPTIQEWFVEFYDTLGIMRDVQAAPAKVALLFMVFAQARVYMPDNDRPGPPDLRLVVHFLRDCFWNLY